ncbi:hypothetical protein [Piscinibacter sp. HJYY11]|uniref:hypothetical protein n=1 Tax=Piscinibacter sp. HJYY11 TaxID=2801333 RepID=UPI00191CB810|nr:hypothetical protein [Piscinibacter sp. HJYY11]MBL0730742.1 hypothetical protein [Piscinibacter sp. HJYY11]
MELIGGLAALVFGIHAIATKRVAFTGNDDEPETWIYGTRAVAIGCVALATAGVFFASAVGMIHWSAFSL